jgi:large subunit ribosomal protein L3
VLMIAGLWGKKIGMTQVFEGDKVVPVTAINVEDWFITGIKNEERDGYNALQVGLVRNRYVGQSFSNDWIKKPNRYFYFVREIKMPQLVEGVAVGQKVTSHAVLAAGDEVNVFGLTKGCGFAGAVRRHGFTGAPASHGATMGKRTGSLGGARAEGEVFKGKKMPGHMGTNRRTVQGLSVVKIVESPESVILVKGSVPGKSGSLVFIRKAS